METLTMLFVLIISTGLIVFAGILLIQNLFGIPPYVPSGLKDIRKALLEVEDRQNKTFVDLGSGDGKIARLAAQLGFKQSVAVEINPFLVYFARLRNIPAKRKIKNVRGSYFKHDVGKYDVIFTYLFPQTMQQLEEKLWNELSPGSVIISNTFSFGQHTEDKKWGKVKRYMV